MLNCNIKGRTRLHSHVWRAYLNVHIINACVANWSPREENQLVTGETYIIKGHLSCESNYVIYVLECPCGLQYVGRTMQKLRERVNKHCFNIRHKIMHHSVSRHFAHHHGRDPELWSVIPLEQVKATLSRFRLLCGRESFWRVILDTLYPKGLNEIN